MRQATHGFWPLAVGLWMLILGITYTGPTPGWGRDFSSYQVRTGVRHGHRPYRHHGHRHDHGHRPYHRVRHHYHGHHHDGFHTFLGFRFYGYPYGYPYWPYYDVIPYAPGEHRRFPAFRLPAFFHYPGALGKVERTDNNVTTQPNDQGLQEGGQR